MQQLPPSGRTWFERSAKKTTFESFMTELARTPIMTSKGRILLNDASTRESAWQDLDWLLLDAELTEVVRVALIAAQARENRPNLVPFLTECFRQGDHAEKRAVLRALPLVPHDEDALAGLIELGIAGCRSNARDVFDGICCDNPFPAQCFPDQAFNQMVLKALFVGAPLSHVVGLDDRINPELERMARSYASERRAAGRTVPSDISILLIVS